jgi:hypothetical protein
MEFPEPSLQIFSAEFVNVSVTVNLDIVSHLDNINAVEYVKEVLALNRHCEFLIKHIKKDIGGTLVLGPNGKVNNLSFKDNLVAINNTGIETRFVDCRCESEVAQDGVGMFFPTDEETRGVLALLIGPG